MIAEDLLSDQVNPLTGAEKQGGKLKKKRNGVPAGYFNSRRISAEAAGIRTKNRKFCIPCLNFPRKQKFIDAKEKQACRDHFRSACLPTQNTLNNSVMFTEQIYGE
ncbi:MAG: hypothetical protein M3Q07_22200 [Pseudobdellovibrionaceae bacterium]|nr:hypothetical protein [Pseudobdellovibrionaceae bacterium]